MHNKMIWHTFAGTTANYPFASMKTTGNESCVWALLCPSSIHLNTSYRNTTYTCPVIRCTNVSFYINIHFITVEYYVAKIFLYEISIPKMLWQFGKFDIFAFIISCPRKFLYFPNFNFQLFCWRYDRASVAGSGIAIGYWIGIECGGGG